MKALAAIIFCALLLFMAALQLNDTDGIWWMIVYATAALVPVCQVFLSEEQAGIQTAVFRISLVLAVVALLSTFPEVNMNLDSLQESVASPMAVATPYIEGNRELFGALITIAIILSFRSHSAPKRPS